MTKSRCKHWRGLSNSEAQTRGQSHLISTAYASDSELLSSPSWFYQKQWKMSTVPRLGSTTMALANRHVKIQDDINTGILTCLLCHGFSLVKAANCSSTKDQETSWLLRICLKAADCPAVLFRWYQLSTVLSVTKKEVKEKRLPNTLGNLLPLERFDCSTHRWFPNSYIGSSK